MPPTVLANRFELLARAASGGMGSVWRARDRTTGRTVAVKVLALDRPFDLIRFERECTMLANLDHPNVVRYVAHGRERDIHFLAQEWVDGVTIATQFATFGATAAEAHALGIGIADALAAAHHLGIIHRDVKPANVILDGGDVGRIKLVDFGIARLASDAGVLTRTGVLIGTPSYMAPEQARGSVVIVPAADVWSLGCVIYEALTGRKAFAGRTPEAIRAKVLLMEPESVLGCCPEAGEPFASLVRSMLSKGVAERPADGARAAAALRALGPIANGPRRPIGGAVAATAVLPNRKQESDRGAANCFVYFTAPPLEDDQPPAPVEKLKRISDKYNLELHEIDDGSVIMRAPELGVAGAIAVTNAALELKQEIFDGAVSVFGQAYDETLGEAIDRGADAQARASMETMFADAVEGDGGTIRVDDFIAEMVCEEIAIERTETGAVVSARRLGIG